MDLECSYIDITVRTSVSYKKERCLRQFLASVATSLLGLRCSEVLDYGSSRILTNEGCLWEKEECMTSPKVRLVVGPLYCHTIASNGHVTGFMKTMSTLCSKSPISLKRLIMKHSFNYK